MFKITTPGYQLCEVLAMQWVRTLAGGANKPIVIRGADSREKESNDFVLKYQGAERMDRAACRRELLAAFIAAELEIAVPEPAVIRVGEKFIQTLPPDLNPLISSKAIGINFGNRYIHPNIPFTPTPDLPKELIQSAARIFAFDTLLKNADRRPEKPNSFLADGQIYVYDHELSFGFLVTLPMFLSADAWHLNPTDISAAQDHIFYPSLHQNKNVNWQAAVSTFSNLTADFWSKAERLIPFDWRDEEETNRIRKHIESVQQHLTEFTAEIWNKLMA